MVGVVMLAIAPACGGGSGPTASGDGSEPTPAVVATSTPAATASPSPTATVGPAVIAIGCGPTAIEPPADCPPGLLVRSDDGGNSWTQWRVTGTSFVDLDFIDRRTAWAVADSGLLQSTDGGATWEERDARLPAIGGRRGLATGVQFADARTGVVVGWLWRGGFISDGSFVLLTRDGGETWDVVLSGAGAGESGRLSRACFTRAGVALASGPGLTAVSLDGGQSWRRVDDETRPGPSGGSVACTGEADLWIIDRYPRLWHSADAGRTWEDLAQRLPPDPRAFSARIGFLDELFGWITRGTKEIVLTRDGGATWESQDLVRGTVPFDIAVFLDRRTGIAFSWGVGVLTEDDGDHWQLVGITRDLSRFHDVEVVR